MAKGKEMVEAMHRMDEDFADGIRTSRKESRRITLV